MSKANELKPCPFCELGKPIVTGDTNDKGIVIKYPNTLIAYGYDIHGSGSNGLTVKINNCPMCGRKLQKRTGGLTMYPYHNTIKKRIKNGELVRYEYVDNYKNIGECLLLHFNTHPFERPIRPRKYLEYIDILVDWKNNRRTDNEH